MSEAILEREPETVEQVPYMDPDQALAESISKMTDEYGVEDQKTEEDSQTPESVPVPDEVADLTATETEEEEEKDILEIIDEEPENLVNHLRKTQRNTKRELTATEQKLAEAQRERDELLRKIEEANSKVPSVPEPVNDPPELVFNTLLAIKNGDFDNDYRLPQIKSAANDSLSNMTKSDLVGLYKKLNAGFFGENTEDIRDLVNERATEISLMSSVVEKTKSKEAEWHEERNKLTKQIDSIPGINDPNSPIGLEYIKATDDLQKYIPNLKTLAKAPALILKHMTMRQALKSANTAKDKRIKELEAKLNINQSPSSSSGSNIDSKPGAELSAMEEFAEWHRANYGS